MNTSTLTLESLGVKASFIREVMLPFTWLRFRSANTVTRYYMSGVLTIGLYTTNDILGGNNMSGLFVAPIVIDNDHVTLSHDVVDWFVILLYDELVSIENKWPDINMWFQPHMTERPRTIRCSNRDFKWNREITKMWIGVSFLRKTHMQN